MHNRATNTPTRQRLLRMAAVIIAASVLGLSAHAADRMVLGEYFTMIG